MEAHHLFDSYKYKGLGDWGDFIAFSKKSLMQQGGTVNK